MYPFVRTGSLTLYLGRIKHSFPLRTNNTWSYITAITTMNVTTHLTYAAMIQGLVLFKAHQISMKKEQMQGVSPLKKEQFEQNSEKINLRSNFKNNLVVNAVLQNCSALTD